MIEVEQRIEAANGIELFASTIGISIGASIVIVPLCQRVQRHLTLMKSGIYADPFGCINSVQIIGSCSLALARWASKHHLCAKRKEYCSALSEPQPPVDDASSVEIMKHRLKTRVGHAACAIRKQSVENSLPGNIKSHWLLAHEYMPSEAERVAC